VKLKQDLRKSGLTKTQVILKNQIAKIHESSANN